ncbi:MAG: hypothetical protein F4X57_10990 [Chloroflexi bacterium]|nr:hypothetical protein [Chloroflexota bacterium]
MTDIAEPYTIYFAGQLFDHKHLVGNALLAADINDYSQGRYRCILPQDLEQRGIGPMGIRDQDLRAVIECDLSLFNFDGAEIPVGAVAEYMYAKMLDIPAVILRTDFRGGGDQDAKGDPWNLMVSFYPRTRILHIDGMQWYQDALAQGGDAAEVSARYHRRIAAEVVTLLDEARAMTPIMEGGRAGAEREYRWALRMAGGSLTALAADAEYIRRVVSRKIALGLLPDEG